MDQCRPVILSIKRKLGKIKHEAHEKGNTKAQKQAWKTLLKDYKKIVKICKKAGKY